LDEELRGLADARPTADFNDRFGDVDTVRDAYEERHTGIERRYGDDDL
jgi:hypothetical protein